MINFKENLYTTQWLDLVFQNRNKSYGAYELRKHNNETTSKALAYACILFSAFIIVPWMYGLITPVSVITVPDSSDPIEVTLTRIQEEKTIIPPSHTAKPEPPKSVQYTRMVVAPTVPDNVEPPSQLEIEQAVIGPETIAGTKGAEINPITLSTGNTEGTGIAEPVSENTIFTLDAIEKYPQFPGGAEAFSKYLSRHLRYPGAAAEKGIQGKVLVSFIIERNGELSNIKIVRSIGGGCDEEAMRVLAKSPKWSPGIQNNQQVRVAYNIPINFRLPD